MATTVTGYFLKKQFFSPLRASKGNFVCQLKVTQVVSYANFFFKYSNSNAIPVKQAGKDACCRFYLQQEL